MFPTTTAEWLQAICDKLGVPLATPTFTNSDTELDCRPYLKDGASYRDAVKEIAGSAGCFAQIINDELNIKWFGSFEKGKNILDLSALQECATNDLDFSNVPVEEFQVEPNKVRVKPSIATAGNWQSVGFLMPFKVSDWYTLSCNITSESGALALSPKYGYFCLWAFERGTKNFIYDVEMSINAMGRVTFTEYIDIELYDYWIVFAPHNNRAITSVNQTTIIYDEIYIVREDEFSGYEPYTNNEKIQVIDDWFSLSQEDTTEPINTVVLGRGDTENNIVYPEEWEDVISDKNLLNITQESFTQDGLTITRNNDGTYTINGTATTDEYCYFDIQPIPRFVRTPLRIIWKDT